jgi:hypothetical protein
MLERLIEEAIVDAYGDSEQMTSLFTMMDENLSTPFVTVVLGQTATVEHGHGRRISAGSFTARTAAGPLHAAENTDKFSPGGARETCATRQLRTRTSHDRLTCAAE